MVALWHSILHYFTSKPKVTDPEKPKPNQDTFANYHKHKLSHSHKPHLGCEPTCAAELSVCSTATAERKG